LGHILAPKLGIVDESLSWASSNVRIRLPGLHVS
jgi:hypothetical protein